jgi:hypothetical protein
VTRTPAGRVGGLPRIPGVPQWPTALPRSPALTS